MGSTQPQSDEKQVRSVKDKVQGVINLIRPAVQADGGDIELVNAFPAASCRNPFPRGMSRLPLQHHDSANGNKAQLHNGVPEVTSVVPVP